MTTIQFKEKKDVNRNVRFTKSEIKLIYAFCKRNKMQFSDLVRVSVMKNISHEA